MDDLDDRNIVALNSFTDTIDDFGPHGCLWLQSMQGFRKQELRNAPSCPVCEWYL